MKLTVDTAARTIVREADGRKVEMDLFSVEAFEEISALWLKLGWNAKYPYTFSWMGRPVIQIPEDMVRLQEVIYRVKPDVLVETGVAHGGSLVFSASLFQAMGRGRVVGVDIEIRPHNRRSLEEHELFHRITLVEGSSVDSDVVRHVKSLVAPGEVAMIVLDSCHTKAHVRAELEAYHDLVAPGSYIIATDGSMKDLFDVPRGKPDWEWDHPTAAAAEFVAVHPEFELEQPPWPFNESALKRNITHWPGAWLRRKGRRD